MDHLAIQFRALQIFAHRAHHDTHGETFFQDHEFFGKLYPAYESAYDDVVERIIGLGSETLNLAKINEEAAKHAAIKPNEHSPHVFFNVLLATEKQLCQMCAEAMKKATEGTKNLLAQLCDDSEKRQFLIKKRIAK